MMCEPLCTKIRTVTKLVLSAIMLTLSGNELLHAASANFVTGFEILEGYSTGTGLDGQPAAAPPDQQWLALAYGPGGPSDYVFANDSGNGVVTGGLGGSEQAAYAGLTPLPAGHNNYLDLYVANTNGGLASVSFSVTLKFIGSTNGRNDFFRWDFYNGGGDFFFALRFNMATHTIDRLDSSNQVVATGLGFTNGVEYNLAVNMNFAANLYSATFNGALLVTTKPITVKNSSLDFWSADAIWQPAAPATPGDNYMLFDNYRITFASNQATLSVLSPGGNGPATVRLTGPEGNRYALDASTNLVSWLPVVTNTITGGFTDYADPASVGKPARYYRARFVP